MPGIVDAGAILLDTNFALEIGRHALEFGDHGFDLRDLAALFVDLKLLQANERLSGLHRLLLPRSQSKNWGQRPRKSRRGAPIAKIVARITLAFGFRGGHNLSQTEITFRQAGCFFLTLGQEVLDRLMQPDGLVDVGARPGPIGPKPDKLLHIRIGCHDLAGPGQGGQKAGSAARGIVRETDSAH